MQIYTFTELNAHSTSNGRMSGTEAGYMELKGAKKDGECSKVKVTNGVSFKRGCCNEFDPEAETTKRFSCGTCEYKRSK